MNVTRRQLLKYSAALAAASAIGLDLALPEELAAAGDVERGLETAVAVSSVIVAIEEGAIEQVLPRLGAVPGVSVFGVKDNRIVTVIEGRTPAAVNEVVKDLSELARVIGVHPVYTGSGGRREI